MTVATKILMGSGAVAEAYEIEQSLIFDETRGSFLGRASSAISAGNQRTFTFSTWVKICSKAASANNTHLMMARPTAGGGPLFSIVVLGTEKQLYIFEKDDSSTGVWVLHCSAVLRDPAAWYHIVVAVDTTQGAEANRVKPYINGVLQTSFVGAGYPDQNAQMPWNEGAEPQYLGWNAGSSGDFYMAETHSIDGAAKAASDFGETNDDTGQWIPKKYSGSYGTNGFYLKFVSGAIGTDSSGESNNYTATNLANSDVVIDTPTNNFATLNPAVSATSGMVLSEGNLHGVFRSASITNAQQAVSTIDIPAGSGKWYWEMRQTYTGLGFIMGIVPKGELPRMSYAGSLGYGYVNAGGVKNINATESSYATAWFSSGQTYIISCYYDSDNRKVGFKLNNTDQGYLSEDVTAGSYAAVFSNASGGSGSQPTTINFGQNGTFSGTVTAQGNADTNGIGDFYYAPPSGYKALCTSNLPDPAIPLPSAHFNTVLYTGDDGTSHAITGVGHQPDFTWIKNRSAANSHILTDAVRGVTKTLLSESTSAELTLAQGLKAFGSDGFTVGFDDTDIVNGASNNYVSWNWKANGSGSTDTSGDIDSVVSANQAAGFSIVTWTGDGSEGNTLAHGLGVVPELIIRKIKNAASSWATLTTVIDGSNDQLYLNLTDAKSNLPAGYGSLTSSFMMNMEYTSSHNVVAYCFASKPGFSKIGIYTGNGNASGPFISTGFKPAWVMVKRTDAAKDWIILDVKRDIDNVANHRLFPNLADAEATAQLPMDILSNGFKLRISDSNYNANAGTYLYLAFADSPFKTSNAR
jgi:hypothetical protein